MTGFKPVGVDNNSLFPTRVMTALKNFFPSKADVAGTRRAIYALTSCGATAPISANFSASARLRMKPPKAWTRIRFRLRNYVGLADGGTATDPIRIGNVYLGREAIGKPMTYAAPPELVSAGSGATSISGLTEFVTGWYTPTDATMQSAQTALCLSYVLTNPTGTQVNVASGSEMCYLAFDGSSAGNTATTNFGIYNIAPLEVIAEYEFIDNAAKVVFFLGDSVPDGYSVPGQAGWWGHYTGWPQKWARRTGNIAAVDAYSGSLLTSWASGSQKFARLDGTTPDAIVIHLGGNDLRGGADLPTMQTRYSTFVATVRAKWPGVPIYAANVLPSSTNTSGQDTVRTGFNAWLPTADVLDLAGVFDFDRAVRDLAVNTQIAADLISSDNLHPNVRGADRLADATTIPGNGFSLTA